MLKRFLKDSLVYGASNFLSRGIGLLLLPLYTRVLSPTQYGMVDLMQVVRSLVALTLALEIVQALVRFFPDAPTDAEKRVLASTALWFTAGMYAAFTVVALVWARPLSRWLMDAPGHEAPFRAGVLYIAVAGVFTLMQELLRFDFRARAYAAASLLNVGVVALVTVALLLATPLRVTAVFAGLTAGSAAGAAYAWRAARHRYGVVFRAAACREMLAFSFPLVFSSAAAFVALFIDRIAIRHLMTIADLGVYGVAARFASTTALLTAVLQMALTPLVYNRHAEPETPGEIARILRMVAAALLPMIAGLGVFAPEAIAFVTTPEYLAAAPVVPLLAAGVILSQFWVFAPGLGLGKRTRTIALLNVTGAVLNTGLNFLLIPRWGLAGAGAATLAGGAFTAAGYVLLGRRHYAVPHAWARLGAAAAVTVAALLAAGAVWGQDPTVGPGAWAGKGALWLAAAAAAAAVLLTGDEVRQAAALLRRGRRPG